MKQLTRLKKIAMSVASSETEKMFLATIIETAYKLGRVERGRHGQKKN